MTGEIRVEKKYILMSPHPDDTCFSLSGTILKNNVNIQFVNCDVFTKKKYNILHVPEDRAYDIIIDEEAEAVRKMNIANIMLGYEDSYTRSRSKLSNILGKEISEAEIIQETIYKEVKQSICRVINDLHPDAVFAPLGCGWHKDHLIVKKSIEECFKNEEWFTLYFYEDMPYSANSSWLAKGLENACAKYILEEKIIKIDDVIEQKNELLQIYKTQIKSRDIRMMNAYMRNIKEGFICERFWKVKQERRN